ncbi:MAG: NAD synthetase, partial [Lysobacteraceae bacterium]
MNFISMNVVTLLYLVASVCFIQALKGLSSPSTARLGNTFGMAGMAIAVVTTIALMLKLQAELATGGGMGFTLVLLGVVVGGGIGAVAAKKVEMTKMPELVAAMHSLIGLAAVCIAIAAVSEPWAFNIAERGGAL